eukprot:jgi/Ulvmu1/11629/UM008_0033.1
MSRSGGSCLEGGEPIDTSDAGSVDGGKDVPVVKAVSSAIVAAAATAAAADAQDSLPAAAAQEAQTTGAGCAAVDGAGDAADGGASMRGEELRAMQSLRQVVSEALPDLWINPGR